MADTNLVAALCKAKLEFKPVAKTKTAEAGKFSYSYADLATVIDATRDALAKHGLAIIHFTRFSEGLFSLETTLNHVSGESLSSTWWLPDPSKTGPQQLGSALSYGRRYNTLSLLDIAAEDDLDAANIKDTTASKRSAPPTPRDQGRAVPPKGTARPPDADSDDDEIIEGTILGMINGIEQTATLDEWTKWGRRYAKEITPENLGKSGYDRVRAAYAEQKKKLETTEIDPPWEEEEAKRQDDDMERIAREGFGG